tara:strand:- start:225444 stop:226523 length:1080 start_codon:yes stop_codon:yes gene_type:complete
MHLQLLKMSIFVMVTLPALAFADDGSPANQQNSSQNLSGDSASQASNTPATAPEPKKQTAEDKARQKASEMLHDYLMKMQSMGDYAFLHVGESRQVLSEARFSGTFPFTGFQAVRYPKSDGQKRERFWFISSRTFIPSHITGFGYDELLIGDKCWFTRAAGQVRKYEPDPNHPFQQNAMHLEPRVAVLCFCGAVDKGLSSQPKYHRHISQENLLKAKETLAGIKAVFEDKYYWYHLLFDRSQGNMPTRFAATEIGTELDENRSNAGKVNRMRWKRMKDDLWLPECGENIDYYDGTLAAYDRIKRLTYRIVWIPPEELPAEIFTKNDLSSHPAIRRAAAEKWIQAANAIEPIDEDKHGAR